MYYQKGFWPVEVRSKETAVVKVPVMLQCVAVCCGVSSYDLSRRKIRQQLLQSQCSSLKKIHCFKKGAYKTTSTTRMGQQAPKNKKVFATVPVCCGVLQCVAVCCNFLGCDQRRREIKKQLLQSQYCYSVLECVAMF